MMIQPAKDFALKFLKIASKLSSSLGFDGFFSALARLRLVIVLCLAFAVFVILPSQSMELFRYTAQLFADSYRRDFQDPRGLIEAIVLVLSACLLAVSFLVLACLLNVSNGDEASGRTTSRLNRHVLSLIACAPCLAIAAGLSRALVGGDLSKLTEALLRGSQASIIKDLDLTPDQLRQLSGFDAVMQLQLNWGLHVGIVVFLSLALAFFFVGRAFGSLEGGHGSSSRAASRLIALGLMLPVVLSIAFVVFPVSLARGLTSFGVVCLFFLTMALFLAALRLVELRTQKPLLFLLLICSFAFGVFGLNDNHSIRELVSRPSGMASPPAVQPRPSIGVGFKRWLDARREKADFNAARSYPVYVVAAEGGGIYAAFRTATFLATLQDECPRFSHHLFAISSVSGGSVGAAVYSGLLRKVKQGDERFQPNSGCVKVGANTGGLFFNDLAEDILKDDFLSPVLAAFLFPDFLQKFLFFPISQFDRSIALEKSLETSWDRQTWKYRAKFPERWVDDANPLRESFADQWNSKSDVPALFINTTEIESGRGRAFAPFAIQTSEVSSFPLSGLNTGNDAAGLDIPLRLSTAAVISARFPWLTPPGSFLQTGQVAKVHLVDGGYLDNSGVVTALAIVREMEAALNEMSPRPKVEINLIVLTSKDFSDLPIMLGDYLAPLQTLDSTRMARGTIAVEQAERQLSETKSTVLEKAELVGYSYPLPLGWRLSLITRTLVLGQNGDASRCRPGKNTTAVIDDLDCLKAKIHRELSE
jgi:hypothetical protein